MQKHSK